MKPKRTTNQRVLVSPLEWGLGHATRLSAIISFLLKENFEVIIAADGLPYHFLSQRFPQLFIERLPLKQIKYARSGLGFFLKLAAQMPAFFYSIKRAKPIIDHLVHKYQIDLIISDNRYGFLHPSVPSAFITHQLCPMPPWPWRWGQKLFARFHLWLLRNYSAIWVADFPGPNNVVGSLSGCRKIRKNIRYIGPQSWLCQFKNSRNKLKESYDILVMLSGIEPQRTELEQLIISKLKNTKNQKVLILQGLPSDTNGFISHPVYSHIHIVNHLEGEEIFQLIKQTPKIICRAGVVTIFDLVMLKRTAMLIPTPGQTEQKYVADYLSRKGYFRTISQHQLNAEVIDQFSPEDYRIFSPEPQESGLYDSLSKALANLLLPN